MEPFVKNIHQADSSSAKGKDHELKRYKKVKALKIIISGRGLFKITNDEIFHICKDEMIRV